MANDPSLRNELRLIAAEAEVERARADLIETIYEISEVLKPNRIIGELWDNAKEKGAAFAEDAVGAVKERPALVVGVMGAVAAFLAREPIKEAAVKAYDALTSPKDDEVGAAPPPARRSARKPASKPRKAATSRRPAKKVE